MPKQRPMLFAPTTGGNSMLTDAVKWQWKRRDDKMQ